MKVLSLLKSLRPEEYREFEKFLQSPYFKASEQFLKFFRFLCKHHPTFDLGKADLQTAYRRCFGQHSLTDSKLYNLLSGLGKQLEQFLVVQMTLAPDENDECALYDQLLVKSLGMRNMGAYFRTEALRLIDETANRASIGLDDYLLIEHLHRQVYYNPDTPKFVEPHSHLELAAQHLNLYYCIATLRYAAEMKARERILKVHYEIPLLDAVLLHCARSGMVNTNPLLTAYYRLVSLYQQGIDEPGFRDLITVFNAYFPMLARIDQTVLLRHLINFGISLIALDSDVEAELFSLYKLALETNILIDGNRMTHSSFVNIANLASLCQEFDWAESFINQFSPYLEENKRQAAVELAKAGLYYNRGLFDEAQTCLNPEIFTIQFFDILGRVLLLKIVFDRYIYCDKDYEFLITQLKSFGRFIQIKPLTEEKKEAYLNWVRYMRKMAALKFAMVKVSEAQKESLRKKLNPLQPIVSKKWLKSKIDAL